MSERKNKRESEDIAETDSEVTRFVLEPTQIEVGSGFTLAVRYDENERPVVAVKIYGQVDVAQVRKEIERIFPNAWIKCEDHALAVRIVRRDSTRAKDK